MAVLLNPSRRLRLYPRHPSQVADRQDAGIVTGHVKRYQSLMPVFYTQDEWMEDVALYLECRAGCKFNSNELFDSVKGRLQAKYPKSQEGEPRMVRLMMAMQFLELHMDGFKVGGIAIPDSRNPRTAVSFDLIGALWEAFGNATDAQLDGQFDVQAILDRAEQIRDENLS